MDVYIKVIWEKRLNHATDVVHLPQGSEAYLTHGMEDYFYEPAIHIVHNDGNPSTFVKICILYSESSVAGVDEVVITMQDDKYPVTVKLHYVGLPERKSNRTFKLPKSVIGERNHAAS